MVHVTTPHPRRIAILGGGIAGTTAAWQLAQSDRAHGGLDVTLFEASPRLGGIVETVYRDGFTIDCGPDGWVTEKPWARELIRELGLHGKLLGSNDATRATCILVDGKLVEMPAGMRMMVPTDLSALDASPLFSAEAKAAYAAEPARAEELLRTAPQDDESISQFVLRHFGPEVLTRIAAPLLSGVFGGDVSRLSVRAVMPAFVQMERTHGSLILALQAARPRDLNAEPTTIFTSLSGGTGLLIDRLKSELPPHWLRLETPVTSLVRNASEWLVNTEPFDDVILALPAHVTRALLAPLSPRIAELLTLEASSAVIVALAFDRSFPLPRGFGFLVPAAEQNQLLAATFTDQKYADRVPPGCRLLRAFFGGSQADALASEPNDRITALALSELEKILGPLPALAFSIVRHWPHSLPQYEVGHVDRIAELERLTAQLPHLHLIGNAYHGVGLPDLIREARHTARLLIA
jgi:oxygen-dependent protoporphyrinogen oxidase